MTNIILKARARAWLEGALLARTDSNHPPPATSWHPSCLGHYLMLEIVVPLS